MGTAQTLLDGIVVASLDILDAATHIGFGTGTTAEATSQTALTTEIIRKAFDETSIRDNGTGTYDFSATLGLTEGNSNTYAEAGLFNAPSSGTMYARKLLNSTIAKTSTMEVSIGMKITIEAVDVVA